MNNDNEKKTSAGLYGRINMSLKAANALVVGALFLLTVLFIIAVK